MKSFVTEESFWNLFPEARIGIVVAHDMQPTDAVSPEHAQAITWALAAANEAADRHLESNTISQNEVVAVWRDAYQKFKTKKGARCSIENLLKRVLKGNPVGSITPSVDIYNTVSLKYALPVGGEDIDSFDGDIRLGITEGGDAFQPLGDEEDAPTLEGELCYRDNAGAICRCWNWRDGQRTASSSSRWTRPAPTTCAPPPTSWPPSCKSTSAPLSSLSRSSRATTPPWSSTSRP